MQSYHSLRITIILIVEIVMVLSDETGSLNVKRTVVCTYLWISWLLSHHPLKPLVLSAPTTDPLIQLIVKEWGPSSL